MRRLHERFSRMVGRTQGSLINLGRAQRKANLALLNSELDCCEVSARCKTLSSEGELSRAGDQKGLRLASVLLCLRIKVKLWDVCGGLFLRFIMWAFRKKKLFLFYLLKICEETGGCKISLDMSSVSAKCSLFTLEFENVQRCFPGLRGISLHEPQHLCLLSSTFTFDFFFLYKIY